MKLKYCNRTAPALIALAGITVGVASAQRSGMFAATERERKIVPVRTPPSPNPTAVLLEGPLENGQAQSAIFPNVGETVDRKGKLVYALHTATYGAGGFQWPWNNYLTIHNTKNASSVSYRVVTPPHSFVFDPQFSPDGKLVCFKVGNPFDSMGTYNLYIWDEQSRSVEKIPDEHLSRRSIYWSPNSRYIAYMTGGQSSPVRRSGDVRVYVYDLVADKSHFVVEGNIMQGGLAWASTDVLLYTVLSKNTGGGEHVEVQPGIYAFAVSESKANLLIKEGYLPAPSPDNKWLAYYTADGLTAVTGDNPHALHSRKANLALGDATGKNYKIILSEKKDDYTILKWTPDSKRLIIIKSPLRNGSLAVEVDSYELSTGTQRALGRVWIKANLSLNADSYPPLFLPLNISQDGKFLFFQSTRQGESDIKDGCYLESFNLESGETSIHFGVGTGSGIHWHPE